MDRRLDSGAVLSRARPVLTFATLVPEESLLDAGALEPRPSPSPVSLQAASRSAQLPVIPRIVRRQSALDVASPVLSWLAGAPGLVRRSGAGTMLIAGLVIGTLGVIAGLGVWSLPSFVSARASSAVDATGTEPLLARDPLAPRIEQSAPVRPPATTVTVVATPYRAAPRPTPHAALRPLVKPSPRSQTLAIVARR
jgi:hypothetical protein